MKIAYFDCSSGVSGDMILSALVDAGLDEKYLVNQLKKLLIKKFSLKFLNTKKNGIHAKLAHITGGKRLSKFSEIKKTIASSNISKKIKQQGLKIYSHLAAAESKAHSVPIGSVHFHQIAEVDTIIDIFGALIGLEALKIEKVYSSPLNLGKPAPATVEIIKTLPVYSTDTKNELTTPTGAAIISTLADQFGPIPQMKILNTGAGGGLSNLEKPNILRIYAGTAGGNSFSGDSKILLETNIDDMDSRVFPYVQEKLLQNGANDVWLTNIYAKKGRPGIILSVLTAEENEQRLTDIIFSETTTLGIRRLPVTRRILERTKNGIHKTAKLPGHKGTKKRSVEYAEGVKTAAKENIPLKDILRR
ncbi:MAG: nickel pincer cofactor biosynthesis protein LarC [Elusimicrobia bacterium]|nr:nickel pincer cofactor biosynthesis protein LarC [Elusimicrobiota bacterium]